MREKDSVCEYLIIIDKHFVKLSRSAAASKQAEIVEKILADKKRKNSEDIEPPIQLNKSKQNVR